MATSTCSAIPAVRSFLLQLQRDLPEKNNVLMDGRDIGTVVLPHAQLKIFSPPPRRNGPAGYASWKKPVKR